jgi:hypothetical protein
VGTRLGQREVLLQEVRRGGQALNSKRDPPAALNTRHTNIYLLHSK